MSISAVFFCNGKNTISLQKQAGTGFYSIVIFPCRLAQKISCKCLTGV